MKTTESIKAVSHAFVKASAEIKNMIPDSKGYGYTYTSLGCIIDQIKPILGKNELCFLQSPTENGDSLGIETVILHSSGEYLSFNYNIPISQMKQANDTQQAGAAITYGRRYALSAIFGIATDTDIDASSQKKTESKKVEITDKMKEHIKKLCIPSEIDEAIKAVKSEAKYTEQEKSAIVDALNNRLQEIREVK